jgi:hypothetical protein
VCFCGCMYMRICVLSFPVVAASVGASLAQQTLSRDKRRWGSLTKPLSICRLRQRLRLSRTRRQSLIPAAININSFPTMAAGRFSLPPRLGQPEYTTLLARVYLSSLKQGGGGNRTTTQTKTTQRTQHRTTFLRRARSARSAASPRP